MMFFVHIENGVIKLEAADPTDARRAVMLMHPKVRIKKVKLAGGQKKLKAKK